MIVIGWLSTTGEWGFNWGKDLKEIEADFDSSLIAKRDGLRFDDLQWQQLSKRAARCAFNMLYGENTQSRLETVDFDLLGTTTDAWERAIREYGPFEEDA